ncbi:CBS domain-containing protein [Sphingobium sp. B2D3A]|uniref:CBS domain-containing protein n=1 Tax=unclassified Sphingobium TaxID=2611147 RepID=UPI002224F42C|nr:MULTISPECIES: CBS domain-containing protein [unclassified Sphingobium]MCW2336662.1 CBS domain-containing protein [Sphingobium sp. B2D3A]MCW2386416.1 CBS domain-containing protein [Sphingobium sp. B2D3D]MCW2389986.1 CBS domain-containing protein [Sphingobium sp. B11D3B]
MTIRTLLGASYKDVICAARTDSVGHVVALLAERRIGCVPVVKDGKVLGIFSERDVLYGLAREGAQLLDRPVESVMTSPAVTIDLDTPIIAALSLMTTRRIRHLPVMADGEMVAFVSIGDLVKHRMDRIEAEADALRHYIQSA